MRRQGYVVRHVDLRRTAGHQVTASSSVGLDAVRTVDRVAVVHAELDVHLEADDARVAEFEGFEGALQVPGSSYFLETLKSNFFNL